MLVTIQGEKLKTDEYSISRPSARLWDWVRSSVGSILVVLSLMAGIGLIAVSPATAATIGTGAVSIKGPSSELVPGTSVEIRIGTCTGGAVWRTTTGNTPSAYGAFGIGLEPGSYCIVTLGVPAPYGMPANTLFQMGSGSGNWFTVWLPGPISGAVVAKDSVGNGINGVTAFIRSGSCASPGGGVWQNTTASNRWSDGGFGISLTPGVYCTSITGVPWDYSIPAPVETIVTAPGPIWITLWIPSLTIQGTGDTVVPVSIASGERILEFSCPDCTGNVIVKALSSANDDLLINGIGSYPTGRNMIGLTDYAVNDYTQIAIQAKGHWTARILNWTMLRVAGSSVSGNGDDVVILGDSGTVATFSNHGTSNFIVWATDQNAYSGLDLIVNEIGDYWGTRPMRSPALLQVTSNGEWSIDIG